MDLRKLVVRAIFGVLAVSVVVLGAVGIHNYLVAQGGDAGVFNVMFGIVSLFFGVGLLVPGDLPPSLEYAQLAGPAVSAYAAFEVFRGGTERRFRQWRARRRRNHIVLVGFGSSGRMIALQHANRNEACVVAIDPEGPTMNDPIMARPRWAVLSGDATEPSVLVAASAHNASLVHVATGQDGVDIAVSNALRSLVQHRDVRGALSVKVQVDSPILSRRLQQSELERTDAGRVAIEYINLTGLTAAAVLEFVVSELAPKTGPAEDGPIADRLDLIGETPLILELGSLARRSHRARQMLNVPTISAQEPRSLRATTESGESPTIESAVGRLGSVTIVQQAESRATIDEAAELATRQLGGVVIALCPAGGRPLWSAQRSDAGAMLFVDPEYLVQSPDLLTYGPVELMARLIHLDYVHTSGVDRKSPAGSSWAELDETYRGSNRAQAFDFGSKLDAMDCELSDVRTDAAAMTEDEVEMLARLEHERWVDERFEDGWRPGATRDNKAKIHPDLVPYADLSESAKDKDRRVVTRLPALAALIGLVVVRRTDEGTSTRTNSVLS